MQIEKLGKIVNNKIQYETPTHNALSMGNWGTGWGGVIQTGGNIVSYDYINPLGIEIISGSYYYFKEIDDKIVEIIRFKPKRITISREDKFISIETAKLIEQLGIFYLTNISQVHVQNFLRKEYNLIVESLLHTTSQINYRARVWFKPEPNKNCSNWRSEEVYPTYEEALEIGIQKALNYILENNSK